VGGIAAVITLAQKRFRFRDAQIPFLRNIQDIGSVFGVGETGKMSCSHLDRSNLSDNENWWVDAGIQVGSCRTESGSDRMQPLKTSAAGFDTSRRGNRRVEFSIRSLPAHGSVRISWRCFLFFRLTHYSNLPVLAFWHRGSRSCCPGAYSTYGQEPTTV